MNRALLVGINAYPSARLTGCVNDVQDMAQFLVDRCDFAAGDIRLLVDARATTQTIRERLQWLASGLQAGDRVLFHYSGHGSQIALRDVAGDVTAHHDCICPVDFDFSPERALTDVDFAELFSAIPSGVEFNWISDSCNSGDLTRGLTRGHSKSFPMPVDLAWRLRTARERALEAPGFARAIQHLNGAFLSGCRSDQVSADAVFNDRPNGALTYFLLQTLSSPSGLSETMKQVREDTLQALKSNGYDQEPQLRGSPTIVANPFLSSAKSARTVARNVHVAAAGAPFAPSATVRLDHTAFAEAVELLNRVAGQAASGKGALKQQEATVTGSITVHF